MPSITKQMLAYKIYDRMLMVSKSRNFVLNEPNGSEGTW